MRDPLVVALERLIEREGGREVVADEIKSSEQTLYQIVKGVKDSKSGTPKGVGPSLRARLDQRYPGWRVLSEEPESSALGAAGVAPTAIQQLLARKSDISERSQKTLETLLIAAEKNALTDEHWTLLDELTRRFIKDQRKAGK